MFIFAIKICFIFLLVAKSTRAQDPNCDYEQAMVLDETYYVYNREYPSNYSAGTQCRWIATSPPRTIVRLTCSDINMPQTSNCNQDRLLISRVGDRYLTNAERYCGRGTLNLTSVSTKLSIGLVAATNSNGGKFSCTLKAERPSTSPPTGCRCGYKKTNRIVGGMETGINEYPSMVGLFDADDKQIFCGGVIATNKDVITAAHCVHGRNISRTGVIVGEHNVEEGDSSATKAYRIESVVIHSSYSSDTFDNDIAIVRTSKSMEFNNQVGPICMPFKFASETFTGRMVTALGWGTTFFGGPVSPYLQKVDLKVISNDACRSRNPYFLSPRQMCTYTPGKDSCQNDSGGPLVYSDPETRLDFYVATISEGQACASNKPAINTRVTQYLQWISANTDPQQICVK